MVFFAEWMDIKRKLTTKNGLQNMGLMKLFLDSHSLRIPGSGKNDEHLGD